MLIDFLIPTYNRIYPLKSMLSSLLAQTNNNWVANVIIDNPTENLSKYLDFPMDPRITYTVLDERYNDYGHTPREIFKQQSIADYIVMTGDDNYYTPNFVEELISTVGDKPGLVYWDMVHSHFNYQYFKCIPAHGQIDMGAFATRTDLAKQIKLNTGFAADGDFIVDYMRKFGKSEKTVKINKVLFVHN